MIKGTEDYLTAYDNEIKLRGLQAGADRKRQSFKAFRLKFNSDEDVVYAFQNAETHKYLDHNFHENVMGLRLRRRLGMTGALFAEPFLALVCV